MFCAPVVVVDFNLMLEFWKHTGRQWGMMGAVVTGRPVESAWLLHSECDCGNSPKVTHTHTEVKVCLGTVSEKLGNKKKSRIEKSHTFYFEKRPTHTLPFSSLHSSSS